MGKSIRRLKGYLFYTGAATTSTIPSIAIYFLLKNLINTETTVIIALLTGIITFYKLGKYKPRKWQLNKIEKIEYNLAGILIMPMVITTILGLPYFLYTAWKNK